MIKVFIFLLYVSCKLLINTFTQTQGLYKIEKSDKVITIWLRPQSQYFYIWNISPPSPFTKLAGVQVQDVSLFQYGPKNQKEILIQMGIQQGQFIIEETLEMLNQNYTWVNVDLFLTENHLTRVQIKENMFEITQPLDDIQYISTWQNITFSCFIHNEYQEIERFIITKWGNSIFKHQRQYFTNYWKQLQVKIFIQYQKINVLDLPLVIIQDQLGELDLYQDQSNIILLLKSSRKNIKPQETRFPIESSISNFWYSLDLILDSFQITYQFQYLDKTVDGILYFTFSAMRSQNQEHFQISQWIKTNIKFQAYRVYIINKRNENDVFNTENLCYKNCKVCKKLECLECEGTLSLDTYCSCEQNQQFDQKSGSCVDKMDLFQIIQMELPNCELGFFLNSTTNQCQKCPKLNQFTCSDCLYQTEQWREEGLCKFKEIQQLQFLELNAFQIILMDKIDKQQDLQIRVRNINKNYQMIEDANQIIFKGFDVFQISFQLCESDYYYNFEVQRCIKKSKSSLYQIKYRNQLEILCTKGTILINNRCQKCQKGCTVCQYQNKKLICILAIFRHNIDSHQRVYKCKDNCHEITEQDLLLIWDHGEDCMMANCKVCIGGLCLLCFLDYIADPSNFCMHYSYYNDLYQLDMSITHHHKPQLSLYEMLFLSKQLITLNLQIDYHFLTQLMYFANDYTQIGQEILIKQDSIDYRGCEDFTGYMNKTICTKTRTDYKYINNKIKYCPNNNQVCEYDLNFYLDIQLANKPMIVYKGQVFFTLSEFLGGIQITDLSIQNITIYANVSVYDCSSQECVPQSDQLFYFNTNQTKVKYHLILDFLGQVAGFPACAYTQLFKFQTVQIKNLVTYQPIQFQIECLNVTFQNSSFLAQVQPLFIINAIFIKFDRVLIGNFNQRRKQNYIILLNNAEDSVIELFLNNFNISNVQLKTQNLIQNKGSIINGFFSKINIINTLFSQQSSFISTNKSCSIIFQELSILSSNISYSKFLMFQDQQTLLINSLVLQLLDLNGSIFIQTESQLQISICQIIQTNISNSKLVESRNHLAITNFIIVQVILKESQLILSQESGIQIHKLLLLSLEIIFSNNFIEIKNSQSDINQFYIVNSSYYPNFQPISIMNDQGIISFSNLLIINITIDYEKATKYEIYQNSNVFSIINLQSQRIKLNFIVMRQIQGNINQLLYLKSQRLIIDYLNVNGCEISAYEQQLIFIQSQKQLSYQRIFGLIITNIKIKTNGRLLQQDHEGSFSLFKFNCIYSRLQLKQLLISNINTQIETYVFQASTQLINLFLVRITNDYQIGLLHQNNSKSQILGIFQEYSKIVMGNQNFPIFKSYSLFQEELQLKYCKIQNLANPLIRWINKKQLKIIINKLLISQLSSAKDIINLENQNDSNIYSIVSISQIYIFGYYIKSNKQQYLISGFNFQLSMNVVQIVDSQIALFNITNCRKCDLEYFYISNGSLNQPLIQLQDQQGDFRVSQGIIKQIHANSYSLFMIIPNIDEKMVQNLVFKNLQIRDVFISDLVTIQQQNQNYQNSAIILRNLVLLNSQFYKTLLNADSKMAVMSNLTIANTTCDQFLSQNTGSTQILNSFFIELTVKNLFNKQKVLIKKSELYETNLILIDNILKDKQTIQLYNNVFVKLQHQYPIQLSFSFEQNFNLIHLSNQTSQIEFTKSNDIIFVPSGQTFKQFQYYDVKTQQHQKIYQQFTIYLNYQMQSNQDHQIQCTLNQFINGYQQGEFSNYQTFNLTNGKNYLDDFMFIMNPYINIKFLQNNLNCFNSVSNHTIIFNVRIMPCQQGEYLFQNRCIVCDVNKNLYSVTFRAQHCNIIDIHRMENIKIGQIQLKQNYWRPSQQSNKIQECQLQNVCRGGWSHGDRTCMIGRVGALCKECDIYNIQGQGQFAQNNQDCLLCEPNYFVILKGFAILSWLCLITYLNYNNNKQLTIKYLQYKLINHKYSEILMRQSIDQISIIIKIFSNYVFILYLIKDNLNFFNDYLLFTLDFISNPGLVVTSQINCVLVRFYYLDIQYIQLAFRLMVPLVVLSMFYIGYMILIMLKFIKFQFSSILIITYCIYLYNQQLIFEIQIKLLTYVQISGINWQFLNQQFEYFTEAHIRMVKYFIAPSTFVTLLIPFMIFILLKGRDKKSIRNIKQFGHMYCDYKSEVYYWEILRVYSKYITLFFLIQDDDLKQPSVIMFMLVSQFITMQIRPYVLKNLNHLEQIQCSMLQFCLIATYYLSKSIPFATIIILIVINSIFLTHMIKRLYFVVHLQYSQQIQYLNSKLIYKIYKVPMLSKVLKGNSFMPKNSQLNKLKISVYTLQKKQQSLRNQISQINPSDFQGLFKSSKFEIEMPIMSRNSVKIK